MQAIVPDSSQIRAVLKRLESNTPPSDEELNRVLAEQLIRTGLDHWSLWTLICLRKHLDRQKWVGYIVESRLKGDLRKIGCAGAFGHPDDFPQLGDVPDEPDWRYYFHGCGCCLTNKLTGSRIDVDFTREGDSNKIDPFFYSEFLLSFTEPEFPEQLIRREEPFEHWWQVETDRLCAANCIETKQGLRLTSLGLQISELIEPLSKKLGQLLEWGTAAAFRSALYAAFAIGDDVLASRIVSQGDFNADLKSRITLALEASVQSRLLSLQTGSEDKRSYVPSYLAAIADLGPQVSEKCVTHYLFRSPVDGAANTALEIMASWNRPNFVVLLKTLLDQRYKEASGFRSLLSHLRLGVKKENDQHPRTYQITRATLALFQRVSCKSLESELKKRTCFLLENVAGAQSGRAALLMYFLDGQKGLQNLRKALSSKVPAAYTDAAAACVIVGNHKTEEILKDALNNPNPPIQHTVACALVMFPSEGAHRLAQQWFVRNDGIKEPLGKEVTILGRTTPVFTFEEISHANMDEFFQGSLETLRDEFKTVCSSFIPLAEQHRRRSAEP